MKKIRGKRSLILLGLMDALLGIVFIWAFTTSRHDEEVWGTILAIAILILFMLLVISVALKDYFTHWIIYGNGSITIRRVSKECVNGRPVGKLKNREDTFLLNDIDIYGWSVLVLGRCLEYPLGNPRRRSEVLFQLKDGKKICFEMIFYTRGQMNEFMKYIHEGTGLEILKPLY